MKRILGWLVIGLAAGLSASAQAEIETLQATYSEAKEITQSIQYAEDGLHFSKTHSVIDVPHAAGAYRPEAFTDSGTGKRIHWGVHIGKQGGSLPFIERFDLVPHPN